MKATSRREPLVSRFLHIVPLVLAGLLLWAPRVPLLPSLDKRFVPLADWVFWAGVAVAVVGFLFTAWARDHLGRNWSGIVTVKENHELVVTGPYALVRHPIYTGLLLAFAGSTLSRGEWRGVLAVMIVWVALWRKLRLEERWMQDQFGNNTGLTSAASRRWYRSFCEPAEARGSSPQVGSATALVTCD